tara:strand:- start:1282 stop:1629 length:348 start_codon:yes stop_codon:yes gene_type:complete
MPPKTDMNDRLWVANLCMNVLSNPNADRDAISNAREMIRDLIMKRGFMTIPQFTDAPRSRKMGGKSSPKTKKKLSAYNRFQKKLSKQPKYKKMKFATRSRAIAKAWKKTPAGRKK